MAEKLADLIRTQCISGYQSSLATTNKITDHPILRLRTRRARTFQRNTNHCDHSLTAETDPPDHAHGYAWLNNIFCSVFIIRIYKSANGM